MKALKRPVLKLLIFTAIYLLTFSATFAQQLGTPLPPFKTMAFKDFTAPDLQLDVAPILMKTPIFSPHWQPTPFNSRSLGEIMEVAAILSSFSSSPTPFFCRIEENLEKSAKFPVKFRLGDLNYVDRLEKKRDWDLGN